MLTGLYIQTTDLKKLSGRSRSRQASALPEVKSDLPKKAPVKPRHRMGSVKPNFSVDILMTRSTPKSKSIGAAGNVSLVRFFNSCHHIIPQLQ